MSPKMKSLRDKMTAFKQTPEATALELRLSLAQIVLHHLKKKHWSQRKLAEEAGLKESFVSRILHSDDANCELMTAAKLFHALGVKAKFAEASSSDLVEAVLSSQQEIKFIGGKHANAEETISIGPVADSE